MWSDWLVVCDCGFSLSALWCPLSVPTVLLRFLLPWMWGISSWPRLLTLNVGYLLSATCCSSTVASGSCEALEQPHVVHQTHTHTHTHTHTKTVTESAGLAACHSKAKKEARVVKSLLYFRCWQQKEAVGFLSTFKSFNKQREGSTWRNSTVIWWSF